MSDVAVATLTRVMTALVGYSYRHATEKQFHDAVTKALVREGVYFLREYRADPKNILDVFVPHGGEPGGVAVEIKIGGGRSALIRQIFRYAEIPAVDGILVVSTRASHAAVPPTISDKPVRYFIVREFC